MGKLEEREERRMTSIVGSMVDRAPAEPSRKQGRPRLDRETKKRVSLSVLPSLYGDIQKIAHVQRRSVSELVAELLEQYRGEHGQELAEYRTIEKGR